MEDNVEGTGNEYSSNESNKDEEVIENYSYEEYNNQDDTHNDEPNVINENNQQLVENVINEFQNSLNDQNENTNQKEKEQQIQMVNQENKIKNYQEKCVNKVDKTIFSKLSEEMYSNIVKQWNKKNNFNYDEFVNEHFLETYSEKINGDNSKTIREFIERNELYNNHKYYAIETIDFRVDQINTIKKNKKDENKVMNKTLLNSFIDKQLNFIKQRNNFIKLMKEEQEKREQKKIQEKPIVNKSKLFQKKEIASLDKTGSFKKRKTSKSKIKILNQKKENTQTKPPKHKMTNTEIETFINKLSRKGEQKENGGIKNSKSSNNVKNHTLKQTKTEFTLSINLLLDLLLQEIKTIITKLKNESLMNNVSINYQEYLELLFSLGYIRINKISNQLSCKSTDLSHEIWETYLRKVDTDQTKENIIELKTLIIFLLSLEGLISETQLINQKCPWLKVELPHYEPIRQNNIKTKYISLVLNRKEMLSKVKIEKNLIRYSNTLSFKPKLNSTASANYLLTLHQESNYHPIHRLKLSQSYNIISEKHIAKMLKLKDELDNKLLAECSFYPNNKIPPKRSISNEVSNRLYLHNHLLKNKVKTTHKRPSINNEEMQQNGVKATYNQQMFNYNPINDDYLYSKSIERYEKTRLEKQLKHESKAKEVYSIDQLRQLAEQNENNNEHLVNTGFRFDNEIKKHKETFDKFLNSLPVKKELLLSFEIKIHHKKAFLNYYKGDNPDQIVNEFAKQNNLSVDAKKQIKTVLTNRINKIAITELYDIK